MLLIPQEKFDYHFITKKEFQKMISENKFVEWTIYNGNYYGTSKEEIGINKAIILEPNGVRAMQALNQDTIIVFRLLASEITRFNRMIIRQDPLEKIRERISNDKICFSDDNFTNVDYTIDTDMHTILEVTDEVYSLYNKKLSQLNHKA